MSERIGTLILGAGPTGLGVAWKLAGSGNTDWMLCEAERAPGGLASSVLDEHGFTWDLGGHVQFSHYRYFDELMDDLLGKEGWIYHERSSWVRMYGTYVPYPFQLNLRYLPPEQRWEAVRGLLRLDANDAPEPKNFAEWIDRTFGEGIARLFMRPYNFKVWAYPLEQLSWKWIGDRVAVVDVERALGNILLEKDDVSWGPNNKFRFPLRGGTGVVWRRLGERLADAHPGRLRLGERLIELDTRRKIARFESGFQASYERVVSSIPLDVLVASSDLAGELSDAARSLRYSSTHVVGMALNGAPPEALRGKCWMYFPESNCPFYRVTVFSHYSPHNVPDIDRFWSLMAEVSESPEKPVDGDRVVDDTVDGMTAVRLITGREQVHHVWHRRLERGYPTPSLGRDAALHTIQPVLESRDVLSRGRFGAWKYEVSNQDHSFAQGVEAAGRILGGTEEETFHHPEVVNSRRP